jgi:hypothetical protein
VDRVVQRWNRNGHPRAQHDQIGAQHLDSRARAVVSTRMRGSPSVAISTTRSERDRSEIGARSERSTPCLRRWLGAISGNQWQSVAIGGHQWQSVAIRGNPWQSVAISGNQWQSAHLVFEGGSEGAVVRLERLLDLPTGGTQRAVRGQSEGSQRVIRG